MTQIACHLINIGDELLIGQTLNSNAQWLGKIFTQIGVSVTHHASIGDEKTVIRDQLNRSLNEAEIIIITGGLGPTKDDITKKTLCEFFGVELKRFPEWEKRLTHYFESRGRVINELNQTQALLPSNALLLENDEGTAPGMWFTLENKVIVSLPGVPREMKWLMRNKVIPKIKNTFHLPDIQLRILKTVGLGESDLAIALEPWEDNLPGYISLAYLPNLGEVKLRLTGKSNDSEQLTKQLDLEVEKCKKIVGDLLYAEGETSLNEAVAALLQSSGKTLASAESCTGGNVAHQITLVPGSSEYYLGSIVAYSNEVKQRQLGVDSETLSKHGAVSEETVSEMAKGVRMVMGSDIGVSTSGIAGPGGGTTEKPVGTIWIALADDQGVKTKKLQLSANRDKNILLTTLAVLNMLRKRLSLQILD